MAIQFPDDPAKYPGLVAAPTGAGYIDVLAATHGNEDLQRQLGFDDATIAQMVADSSAFAPAGEPPPQPPPIAEPVVTPQPAPRPRGTPGPFASMAEGQAMQQRGFGAAREAVLDQRQAAVKQFDAETKQLDERNALEEQLMAERAQVIDRKRQAEAEQRAKETARRAELERKIGERMAEVEATADEYREAARRGVDPQGWLKNEDGTTNAGKAFGASLAILMGGLGAAISGRPGENVALDIIQKNIDRDIQAQQSKIRGKAEAMAAARGMLDDEVAVGNIQKQLEDEQHLGVLSAFAGELDALDQEYAPEFARMKIAETKTALEEQLQGKLTAIEMTEADLHQRQGAAELQAGATRAGLSMQREAMQAQRDALDEQKAAAIASKLQTAEDLARVGLQGRPIYAEATKEALQLTAASQTMSDDIERLRAHIKKHGTSFDRSAEGKKALAMVRGIQLSIAVQKKLGALSKDDLAITEAMTGDPNSWFTEASLGQLEELHTSMSNDLNNQLKMRGFALTMGGIGTDQRKRAMDEIPAE